MKPVLLGQRGALLVQPTTVDREFFSPGPDAVAAAGEVCECYEASLVGAEKPSALLVGVREAAVESFELVVMSSSLLAGAPFVTAWLALDQLLGVEQRLADLVEDELVEFRLRSAMGRPLKRHICS